MIVASIGVCLLLVGLGHGTPHGCPPYTHDCVPYYQCVDGFINVDGSGLIDIRTRPPKECTSPGYPDVPGLCCQIPGATTPVPTAPPPLDRCPNRQVCLGKGQCNSGVPPNTDGSGLIDIRTSAAYCYLPSREVGVCCAPPVLDQCPGNAACHPENFCNNGDILDSSNNYVPHVATGSWKQCYIKGEPGSPSTNKGVCCRSPNQCGIRNDHHFDLRSGVGKLDKTDARFGEFPWQGIIFFSNYTFQCGASLVNSQWLITAAHCVKGYYPADFKIRLGEWKVDTFEELLRYQDSAVAEIITHPAFNPQNLHNDIAFIRLAEPIIYQYHINSICMPTPGQYIPEGTRCIATGWGRDAFTGNYQAILKNIDLPIVEKSYCQILLRKSRLGKHFQLDNSFMCAGGEQNKDVCKGDGGGPLVCQDSITGRYFIAGITAWGIDCGVKDIPGVYADVQYFHDWIYENTPVFPIIT